ncbi:hypothetical protein ABH926_005389 [Catenulispora sp. GP43]|uniref:hypothetical protein n=1 Tax=Catenulispora sp. GP43 TaxID=3156263 RepID=UPI003516D2E5
MNSLNKTRRLTTGLAFAAAALLGVSAGVAHAAVDRTAGTGLGGWNLVGQTSVSSQFGNQGMATVDPRTGPSYELYRGSGSIPASVAAEGWTHIGDPDSSRGYVFDAYQWGGAAPATSKMFRVTTPSGASYEYTHTLTPGEEYNNSYAAVAPDGKWMVSGEWDVMTRLLVFPTPILNRDAPRTGGELPLAATIELDHPIADVQGCTFLDSRRLLCSTDDSDTTLWPVPKQLLEIDLPTALHGETVTAHVKLVGELPLQSACAATADNPFEVEGDDYDRASGDLRVAIIPPSPCDASTTVYTFRRGGGA